MKRTAERASPDTRTETFSASLKVILTPDEIADRADRAAQKLAERDAKEEEQKAATKHAKSVIEALDAELRRLSNEVRTKATYKSVECERLYDYAEGTLSERRLDTGEALNSRAMTAGERQRLLPMNDGESDRNSNGDES